MYYSINFTNIFLVLDQHTSSLFSALCFEAVVPAVGVVAAVCVGGVGAAVGVDGVVVLALL